MTDLSRRKMLVGAAASAAALGVAATAKAATFGNPDDPAEGAINAKSPSSLSDPGPQNPGLASQFPSTQNPPPTDVNGMPEFWASFNNSPKRIQDGGWARQVTQDDFAISADISGVNMRLSKNGIREMHWHQQAEWAFVTDGDCRITILDELGRPQVADVAPGGLWYFPSGLPHSLQGTSENGTEFLIAFDSGKASEFNTLLVTDWIAHTPPEVLAANFGVPAESFKNIPVNNRWIFQGGDPGSLSSAERAIASPLGAPTNPFVFSLGQPAAGQADRGRHGADRRQQELQGVDNRRSRARHGQAGRHARTSLASERGRVAVLHQRRGPYDRLQYRSASHHQRFPRGRHWLCKEEPRPLRAEHRQPTDLVFLEIFKADHYAEVSLSDWLAHTPPRMVMETLNLSPEILAQFPKTRPDVVPV